MTLLLFDDKTNTNSGYLEQILVSESTSLLYFIV